MAKLEIPVVVDIDAVAELIEELKALQTYKLGVGDDLILVDRDAVVEIFKNHVKAKQREEHKTGRWVVTSDGMLACSNCLETPVNRIIINGNLVYDMTPIKKKMHYCPNCGAEMRCDDGEMG